MNINTKIPNLRRFVLQNFPFIESDFDALTDYALICKVVEYLNSVIQQTNDLTDATVGLIDAFNELKEFVDHYFDNLDVQEEINNKLDEMVDDGTFEQLIKDYILVAPSGNYIDLKRIGRKLDKGTNPSASDYDNTGKAYVIQGGCVINDNNIAYALWDNLTPTLNKNKIVVMNTTDGSIVRSSDLSLGWCNSMALYDDKLYIANRGSYVDGEATYSGVINVLGVGDLLVSDTITLDFNVIAIAHHNDNFYVLGEDNKVYVYDNALSEASSVIDTKDTNYHQDIYVDDNFIYILDSSPANTINVYDFEGNLVRCYNLPKAGGRYVIGEVQFMDNYKDGMMIGSCCTNFETSINQFFYTDFKTNTDTDSFLTADALTLYCNSEVDNFDADGSSTKPFTSINEANFVNIDNIIIAGNNKSYNYTYLSNKKYVRLENATLSEGIYLQYGKYCLQGCTINYSVNTAITACLFARNADVFLNQCTLNGVDNTSYLINSNIYNTFNIRECSYTNFRRIFSGKNKTTNITIDSTDNAGFIHNLMNKPYNLCCNGSFSEAYAVDTYNWNTSNTQTQVDDIIKGCNKVIIGAITLGSTSVQEFVFEKLPNQTDLYEITDTTISGSNVNIRLAKSLVQVRKEYLSIVTCATNTIDGDGTRVSTATNANSIMIKYVKLVNE